MTPDELQEVDVYQWGDCAVDFVGADLLTGNGFSLRLSPNFSYKSLFTEFLKQCNSTESSQFQAFDTTNFEEIQYKLLSTKNVNSIYDIECPQIPPAVSKLRDGLIATIQANHPSASETNDSAITALSQSLDTFSNIYTLNYDLYMYRIIMASLDRHKVNPSIRPYQDYFWDKWGSKYMAHQDYQSYDKYKHVYYVHGALFLFPAHVVGHKADVKVRRSVNTELIDIIGQQIKDGILPLFVSEGDSAKKHSTINRSPYLNFAYSQLKKCCNRLVIYGTSLDPQFDQHIIDALSREKRNIAVSIYVGSKTLVQIKAETHTIKARLSNHEVVVFDSSGLF